MSFDHDGERPPSEDAESTRKLLAESLGEKASERPVQQIFRRYFAAGFRRLVPIIPPDLVVSPTSHIKDHALGKAVGFKGNDGLWRGFDWTKLSETTPEQCDSWHEMGAGLGIRTGHGIYGLDVDILDPDSAARIKDIALDIFGPAPVRVGRAPKFLLVYRSEVDLPYSRIEFPNGQRVELLAEGRQFVAEGIHPITGKPYELPEGRVGLEGLVAITAERVDRFYSAVRAEFPQAAHAVTTSGIRAADQNSLRGRREHVHNALTKLPNPAEWSRDDWLDVGYSVKAALQDDPEAAFDEWFEWAQKWEGGENTVERSQNEWARMKPPFGIGAQWLYDKAAKYGFDRGAVFVEQFDVLPGCGSDQKRFKVSLDRTSFSVEELDALKPPEFVLGSRFQPGQIALGVGPPGVSKSTFAILSAVSIATGRSLTGEPVFQSGPVLIYNAEDPRDVILRRINAVAKRFSLDRNLLAERVHVLSGYDGARLVFSERPSPGAPIQSGPALSALESLVREAGIIHVVLDPMVGLHRGLEENSAADMERLGSEIRDFVRRTGVSVDLIHHSVKNQSGNSERNAGVADAARGSGAILAFVRSVYTIVPMDAATARDLGIAAADAAQIVRLDDGKKNHTRRSGRQRWFKIESVLPNGAVILGDEFESENKDELRKAHSSAPVHTPFNFASRQALAVFDKAASAEKQTEALRDFVASMMEGPTLERKLAVERWGEIRGIKETMARSDIDKAIPRGRRGAVKAAAQGTHQLLWSDEKQQGRTKKIMICREITGQIAPKNEEINAGTDLFA